MVAAPAVPCGPSSSSLVLLDVFPMISYGLRDFTQEPYFGSPKQVRLNIVLVTIPFARAHSCAFQAWSVTLVNSKMSYSTRMPLLPPHLMTTAFDSIGAEFNEWATDLCPTGLVSTGGRSGVKVTAASTVRGGALLLLIPSIYLVGPEVDHQALGPAGLGRSFSLCCYLGRSRRQCFLGFHCHGSVITHKKMVFGSQSPLKLHAALYNPKCPSVILRGEGLTLKQPGQGRAFRDEDEWSCLEV